MRAQIEERKANTPRSRAKREALVKAMKLKNYEFTAHGVDLGQCYQSAAVAGDGTPRPDPARDPELYYRASTVPGSHLPHAWVGAASPDKFIGWRCMTLPADPGQALRSALRAILSR